MGRTYAGEITQGNNRLTDLEISVVKRPREGPLTRWWDGMKLLTAKLDTRGTGQKGNSTLEALDTRGTGH